MREQLAWEVKNSMCDVPASSFATANCQPLIKFIYCRFFFFYSECRLGVEIKIKLMRTRVCALHKFGTRMPYQLTSLSLVA